MREIDSIYLRAFVYLQIAKVVSSEVEGCHETVLYALQRCSSAQLFVNYIVVREGQLVNIGKDYLCRRS